MSQTFFFSRFFSESRLKQFALQKFFFQETLLVSPDYCVGRLYFTEKNRRLRIVEFEILVRFLRIFVRVAVFAAVQAGVADCPAASFQLHRNLLKPHPPYERMNALARVPLELPAEIKFRPAAESRHIVNRNLGCQVEKDIVNRLVDCLPWNHAKDYSRIFSLEKPAVTGV